jgi:hypothetical protein
VWLSRDPGRDRQHHRRPGPIANFSVGVWYDTDATGEVSGNTISNFFDSDAGT